jgi:flagellar basal body P-ring formation protein FlgA
MNPDTGPRAFCCCLLAVFLMASAAPPETEGAGRGGLRILIAEEATVSGDTVALGHVATFHPDTDPRVEALRQLELSAAPAPGNTHRFNARFLNYKLGAALRGRGEGVVLETPPSLLIHRTAQVVTSARMADIFRGHILREAPWGEDEITIESLRVPDDIALPEGGLCWDVRGNGNGDYLGNVSGTLTFHVDGRMTRRVPVSARVSVSREVLRSARNIRRGDVISDGDIERVQETTFRLRGDVLDARGDAVGKQATRAIRAGSNITAAMVQEPPLVERGKTVIITAENESLRITTRGEALEDGRAGESIRVRNLRSGKNLPSIVTGPGTVTVRF